MPRIAKKSGAYHHGDLRRVLLQTAVKVLEQEGVSALSLQALARRAGVSSGAPYHHFASREELLGAIAAEGFELLVAAMKQGAQQSGTGAAEHLRGLGLGYIRFAIAHPGHFRVMFRPELQAQLACLPTTHGSDAFDMLRQAVLRCQAEGLTPPGDPMPFVLTAWTCVHGASALWIDGSMKIMGETQAPEQLATLMAGTVTSLLTRKR